MVSYKVGSILLVCVLNFAVARIWAQEVKFRVGQSEPPYYVGEAATIQIEVEGFDAEPQPTIAIDSSTGKLADGLRGRPGQVAPLVSQQIISKNGRLYQAQQVTYTLNYLVTADKPGDYDVGPLIVKQGSKEVKVASRQFTFESVPSDPELQVKLVLPNKPLYVDQRVPVKIEWWYAGDTDNLEQRSIYSPLFDLFRFAPDEPPQRGENVMPIETNDGTVKLAGSAREVRQEGKNFIVLTSQRIMIPDKVGEFADVSITATIRKVTQWQRRRSQSPFDLFGGSLFESRQPGKVEMGQATEKLQPIVVKPFPTQDRPKSFSGGVGSGFTLDVTADRTVVRVGDPIALTLLLKGDGNIDNAKLPDLSVEGGLAADQFRLPQGEVAGEFTEGSKRFRVSVRVANEGISEIPAIAYSWFDPNTESYQTTYSKPIALRVMPAKVVGAGDVVSSQGVTTNNASTTTPSAKSQTEPTNASSSPTTLFNLSGADLAIEADPSILDSTPSGWRWQDFFDWIIYFIGCSAVAAALLDRTLRQRDPALQLARKCIREQSQRISQAAKLPRRQAAEEIAAALRILMSKLPQVPRDEAMQTIGQCESITYAPSSDDSELLDPALVQKAQMVVEACRV